MGSYSYRNVQGRSRPAWNKGPHSSRRRLPNTLRANRSGSENGKANRIGLCKKFCIEPLTENTFTEAAHFRILHFDTILAGWRRRGFIWVRRAGRSVELVLNRPVGASEVPTVTGIELPPVPFPNRPPEGPPQSPTVHQLETGIGKLPTATGGKTPTEGGGTSPAASISITNTTKTASPGTWPAALRALLQATGYGDDDAVRRMAEGALLNAPDATDDELAYFIRQERRGSSATN